MRRKSFAIAPSSLALIGVLALCSAPARAESPPPQATATTAVREFTYQGVLRASGVPLNGTCDLQYAFWDAASGGVRLTTPQNVTTNVTEGLFTTTLVDPTSAYGSSIFDGRELWIELEVRSPSGSGSYTLLAPRQKLTAAPLAAGLVPYSVTTAQATDPLRPVVAVQVTPSAAVPNPVAIKGTASGIGSAGAQGVWGDSENATGVLGTSRSGYGVKGESIDGWAGHFSGHVAVTGRLVVQRFKTQVAINAVGPLPATSAPFYTYGGTLVLHYSGTGYSAVAGRMIGMEVMLDGNFVDRPGIFANNAGMHLPFVSKTWVLTGIAEGWHTLTLLPAANTFSDFNDIYNVSVTEMPY